MTKEIIVIMYLTGLSFLFIYLFTKKSTECQDLYLKYKASKLMIDELISHINLLKKLNEKNNITNSDEEKVLIRQALKKAMSSSHPDKTGKDTSEEFIKYKNLYEKYK